MPRPNKRNYSKKGSSSKFSKDRNPSGEKEFAEKKFNCNDPSWYVREGQLAKDVASFSFNNALGNVVEIKADNDGGVTNLGSKTMIVPGIMRIFTTPAVGISRDGSSPINLAAKNLYSFVRHANSGHSNYDSPDLMMYIMAMDSIYAFIWHLQRAYGTARVYSQKNRYIGDALLEAMGFIPSEVRSNLANLRSYINMLIVKASAFCTPTTMSIFKRHTWMYSGVFKDEDVEKSQMYLYVPAYLWQYNETSGSPGKCVAKPICVADTVTSTIDAVQRSLGVWMMIGDSLIAACVNSEDINIMSGDILKAYGEGNIWKIGLVPEDFSVTPIYSGEILDQIHNTIFTGRRPRLMDGSVSTDMLNLTQDVLNNAIMYQPIFKESFTCSFEHFLDMEENEPSPEKVLVATRNMIHGITENSTGEYLTFLDSAGSDICLFAQTGKVGAGATSWTYVYDDWSTYIDVEAYTKFHKAPLKYRFASDGTNINADEILGELGNYLLVDKTDIDKVHQSAILSMLGVPV